VCDVGDTARMSRPHDLARPPSEPDTAEGSRLHREPFVHLADLSHDRALVAWGAFWFRRRPHDRRWEIVDDEDLPAVVGRRTCVGHDAEPFGRARVDVLDGAGAVVATAETSDRCWTWVMGLEPDTEYRYRVLVDGEDWAAGERCDWVPSHRGGYDLAPAGRRYDLRFRTFPAPDAATPPVRFVALGDYGVGIRSDSESSRRQRRVGEVLDHLVAEHDVRFVISLGDNIYIGEEGLVDSESGGEDDDWYSSFFQPYRYAIARVPVFPTIGNHDTSETEGSDDRAQMEDNFHTDERFRRHPERASVDPGLFYRLVYGRDLELVCLDTSAAQEHDDVDRYFENPRHREWLHETFADRPPVTWRIPFSHHPVYCAGPSHRNDEAMVRELLPLFDAGGVRLVLAGHEHNFQVSEADGRTYVVSGAGGQLREEVPEHFDGAHTVAWAGQSHLLVVDVDGPVARLTPMSGLLADGEPQLMTALTPDNEVVYPPLIVEAAAPPG
jgi:tartrate-resistant acid phosphatase type 5